MNERVSPQRGTESLTGGLTTSTVLNEALRLPDGARFYRSALQVNPFAYLGRHNKQTTFTNETDYNAAIVQKCRDLNIEIIAVTDHYQVKHSAGLVQAARTAGIFAFGGFEALTKDGVHPSACLIPTKTAALNGSSENAEFTTTMISPRQATRIAWSYWTAPGVGAESALRLMSRVTAVCFKR